MAVCTVCQHPRKASVNDALLRNRPLRKVAAEFGLSAGALHRHKQHLPGRLVQAAQAEVVTETTNLLSRVEELMRESEKIAAAAKKERNWPAATAAMREARSCLELLAKIRGELQSTNVKIGVGVNVNVAPAPVPPETAAELELRIAQEIGQLTDGYDPATLARFKALAAGGNALIVQKPPDS